MRNSSIEKNDRALQLAIDHVVNEYRKKVVVTAAQFSDEVPYGFKTEGWVLFAFTDDKNRLGSDKYVAVNMETGETKSMGSYGE